MKKLKQEKSTICISVVRGISLPNFLLDLREVDYLSNNVHGLASLGQENVQVDSSSTQRWLEIVQWSCGGHDCYLRAFLSSM